MYLGFVLATMVVLPIISVIVEVVLQPGADIVFLIGKWFVFWAVGVRLLAAGFSQMLRPGFTSAGIMGVADASADKLVVELGFANTAFGILGVLTYFNLAWIVPVALGGMVFLGLAGLAHVRNPGRSTRENIALASDLFVALVLAVFLIITFTRGGIAGG
jgi:hypothetical protein